jgi:hypothetical protein
LSKTYRNFVRDEEFAYEVVLKIINETMAIEKEQKENERDVPSLLQTILKTEGLDIREKISGVIGELISNIRLVKRKKFEFRGTMNKQNSWSFGVELKALKLELDLLASELD